MKKALLTIAFIAGLSCYTHAGDFTVQLISPPHKILKDEYWAEFKVVLSNGTASAIRIFEKAGSAENWQVFFALTNQVHMDYCLQKDYLREAEPKNTWEALSANRIAHKSTRLLNPGEVHTWNFADIFCPIGDFIPDYLDIIKNDIATMGVYAQVLVGPNQWAHSTTNTVRVHTAMGCDDGTSLFTTTTATPFGMVTTHVREVTVDGVPFLFYGCERICNLTGLGTPTITADPITPTLLTISFGGGAPSIQYDTKKGKLP